MKGSEAVFGAAAGDVPAGAAVASCLSGTGAAAGFAPAGASPSDGVPGSASVPTPAGASPLDGVPGSAGASSTAGVPTSDGLPALDESSATLEPSGKSSRMGKQESSGAKAERIAALIGGASSTDGVPSSTGVSAPASVPVLDTDAADCLLSPLSASERFAAEAVSAVARETSAALDVSALNPSVSGTGSDVSESPVVPAGAAVSASCLSGTGADAGFAPDGASSLASVPTPAGASPSASVPTSAGVPSSTGVSAPSSVPLSSFSFSPAPAPSTSAAGIGGGSRQEAKAVYARARHAEDLRALCAGDLFFLLVYVMRRTDMDRDWTFARCREVQANPDGYLDLWSREHYKSTIITVGLTIQNILNNPDITVGIFSHTRPIAKSFLRQIRREFETNRLLQELFPHICPPKRGEARTWSEDGGITVRRSGNPKENTVEAWGLVDGQPTGKHFDVLVYDDVVTLESVSTPEQIRKTTDAWRLSLNLGARGGVRRMIGTRYHANDTYAELIRQGSVRVRVHPATDDGTFEGRPVLLSREALDEKRRDMGPYVFACQMLQNPLADRADGFRPEWLRYWEARREFWEAMNRVLFVDPAGSRKRGSDYSVFCVVGWNADRNLYLIHGERIRANLTERTATLFRLVREYGPLFVGYEQYGMQADVEHIRSEMARVNYFFTIRELGGKTPKADRIRRLIPWFEQGRLFLPVQSTFRDPEGAVRNFTTEFVEEEYETFPVCAHDDMLDCLARLAEPELEIGFPEVADGMSAVERELARLAAAERRDSNGLLYVWRDDD